MNKVMATEYLQIEDLVYILPEMRIGRVTGVHTHGKEDREEYLIDGLWRDRNSLVKVTLDDELKETHNGSLD